MTINLAAYSPFQLYQFRELAAHGFEIKTVMGSEAAEAIAPRIEQEIDRRNAIVARWGTLTEAAHAHFNLKTPGNDRRILLSRDAV